MAVQLHRSDRPPGLRSRGGYPPKKKRAAVAAVRGVHRYSRDWGPAHSVITMKKKHKPSLFEDVVEFPPEPRQGPSVWARWANALARTRLIAPWRWVRQPKPAD